ncbi:hypothetical protein LLS1_38690 [Leifsonia sp. LS1]|jgi:hypothetical protein|uniref:hypothetical protein n=1 Tax=Leifsonia sp. LS1 TaxID=2828483 RepID=UPI001CFD7ED9|nr:hypothetical protein [Leifsonia sp. LS1]GIT82200.1 hypothetical protein LLS1_38690 [Leifsonia sp. LS1]
MSEEAIDGEPQGPIVALQLGSLFPGAGVERDGARSWPRVAVELQKLSTQAAFVEFNASMKKLPRGTGHALVGRITSTGEQLAIAGTALADARRWLAPDVDPSSAPMAGRALAETAGYFMISAGHGLANATLRTLMLNPAAREKAGVAADTLADPFTQDRRAWISLESGSLRSLRTWARVAGGGHALILAEILSDLVSDLAWKALVETRHRDFHQWRPQSVPGGVNPGNPWQDNGAGSYMLTVGTRATLKPIPAEDAISVADHALMAITRTAEQWLNEWPYALRDIGAPMHKLDEEPGDGGRNTPD